MNLQDLKYLVAVADHRNFSKAAAASFVSQPSLSMQIKKLEEYLGTQLVERTNKQVFITPIGQEVVAVARGILRDAEHIRQIAKQANDPLAGELRLGIIPTVAPYLLPSLLPQIQQHFPKLQLIVVEAQTHVVTEQLRQGKLDAMIVALPIQGESFETASLYEEPFYLAVAVHHPLAKRQFVTQDDLVGERVLLLEEGHCLRDQALEVCQLAGALENANFRATSLETLRHMVASGAGVTLMPEKAVFRDMPSVVYIPFKNTAPARTIGLAWRAGSARKKLLLQMAEVID